MAPLRAIIFDYDGTLIDSEESHFLAWQETLSKYDFHLAFETYLCLHAGQPGRVIANYYAEKVCCNAEKLFIEKSQCYQQKSQKKIIKATINFVHWLIKGKTSLGIKLAIASASPKKEIITFLISKGLLEHFEVILSGCEDLTHYRDPDGVNKPKPYIYQETLKLLGVSVSECVVFEDSHVGTLAAHGAGCFTIAIPNQFTKHHDLSKANLIVDTLDDLQPATFFDLVKERLTAFVRNQEFRE